MNPVADPAPPHPPLGHFLPPVRDSLLSQVPAPAAAPLRDLLGGNQFYVNAEFPSPEQGIADFSG